MSEIVSTQNIMAYVIDSRSYSRMQSLDCKGVDDATTYAEFLAWNFKCINELSLADKSWLFGLGKIIDANRINLMDLDSCASFRASSFYYDLEKKLCIINQR